MTGNQDSPKVVVVTGDVTMDWNFARPRSFPNTGLTWNTEDAIRGYWLRGGAALLAGVIRKVAAKLGPEHKYTVHPLIEPEDRVSPYDSQHHHSYALWSLFKYEEKSGDDDAQVYVWRVKEFLGLQRPEPAAALAVDEWKQLAKEVSRASLVILDDAGLGFRDHPEIWRDALSANERSPWIILKMARPVAHGPLWEHLSQRCPSRLIVVIPVNDLRLTEAQISRELSWERTAQDLAWELVYNPALASLSKCAHAVVSLDAAGAVTLATDDASARPKCKLFFRPEVIEGMWAQKYPGGMIGYTSCLVAGLAREIMLNLEQPDFPQAIQNGIAAMEVLHKEGYGKRERDHGNKPVPFQFPSDLIVEELAKNARSLSMNIVPDPARFMDEPSPDRNAVVPNSWTILQDRCDADEHPANHRFALAEEIVRKGVKPSLKNVPLGQFGKLLTVDRQEIESYRSIRALISEYNRQERPERPLSIAVFGAPGSGKSFGVTEVAKSVLPNRIEKLTFNLSQFNDPKEILGALHKVRDVALSDKVPLVFWDEFDTNLDRPLGWLRYFLSPMQDGSFQEGQITHPIGRAIFVFAGGTSERREDLGTKLKPEERDAAKVRDFVSRLKGYLNILGPNPNQGNIQSDPNYIIRRAILLRSFLEEKAIQLFRPRDRKGEVDIDPGVLRAFLKIQKYEHGARSMESIVTMSVLADKNRFERSSLPAEEQLNLHVNGQAFLALVQQIEFDEDGKLLERLAAKAHDVYCAGLKPDEGEMPPYSKLKYEQLPPEIKEQNRDQVRDIQAKLDLAGYVMIPARVSGRVFSFPARDVELLAEYEHRRWMELKVQNGWRYGSVRDNDAKLHPDLLPWRSKLLDEEPRIQYSAAVREAIGTEELSELAKEKDRISVRGIPNILARAGFTIVKVGV
jgi:hypothetical protein